MTINTKLEVGDIAYFVNEGLKFFGCIIEIRIEVVPYFQKDEGETKIIYQIGSAKRDLFLEEGLLFKSPEELNNYLSCIEPIPVPDLPY